MLIYIYSGGLPEGFVDDDASSLMEISEKYALDQLKILCQERLISRSAAILHIHIQLEQLPLL